MAAGVCILTLPGASILSTSVATASSVGKSIATLPRLKVISGSLEAARQEWEANVVAALRSDSSGSGGGGSGGSSGAAAAAAAADDDDRQVYGIFLLFPLSFFLRLCLDAQKC